MEFIYDLIITPLMEMCRNGTLPDYFQYAFVINALICSLLAGPVLGGIGTMVVAKRLAFFSQAVGKLHSPGSRWVLSLANRTPRLTSHCSASASSSACS